MPLAFKEDVVFSIVLTWLSYCVSFGAFSFEGGGALSMNILCWVGHSCEFVPCADGGNGAALCRGFDSLDPVALLSVIILSVTTPPFYNFLFLATQLVPDPAAAARRSLKPQDRLCLECMSGNAPLPQTARVAVLDRLSEAQGTQAQSVMLTPNLQLYPFRHSACQGRHFPLSETHPTSAPDRPKRMVKNTGCA